MRGSSPRARPLMVVLSFLPTAVFGAAGGLVAWRLAASSSIGARLIAVFVGVLAGWLAMDVIIRPIRFAVSRFRKRDDAPAVSHSGDPVPVDYDDPGWSIGVLFRALVPVWGARQLARETNGLRALRSLYSALVLAPLILLGVLAMLGPSQEVYPPGVVALGVAIVGVQSLLSRRFWSQRPLPTDSGSELLERYRALFFLQFAMADSPILAGFVGFFLGGRLWIYLLGFAFGLIGLLQMAPTRRNIQRRQAQLQATGSTLSLGRLLALPTRTSRAVLDNDGRCGDG